MKLLLYPFSLLYGFIMLIRNKLYDWKIFKVCCFDSPIISVGNLTMGGTGKSPIIEYIIKLIQESKNEHMSTLAHEHMNLSVLSRGYKRTTKGFILASENSTADDIGDEPLQFKMKFDNLTVAVDEDRSHGISQLLNNEQRTTNNVILLDDAFQHRSVKPSLSILLTDFNKLFYKDYIVPAGSLREFRNGYKRSDIIIVTKCPENLTETDRNNIIRQMKPLPAQKVYFSFIKYSNLKPLNKDQTSPFSNLHSPFSILLLAGIANPQPLKIKLTQIYKDITLLSFGDHHKYTNADILKIKKDFEHINNKNKLIITTEKDAMRLKSPDFSEALKNLPIYYQPIEFEIFIEDKSSFDSQILNHISSFQS